MIRVNELRIGNLIIAMGEDYDQGDNKFHDPDGDEMIVTDIDTFKAIQRDSTHYKPIPLTPEWLERCGLTAFIGSTIDDNRYYLQVGNNLYLNNYVRSGNWCVEPEGWNKEQTCWSQPKSVHQLQNLYFALTGEELNVKL